MSSINFLQAQLSRKKLNIIPLQFYPYMRDLYNSYIFLLYVYFTERNQNTKNAHQFQFGGYSNTARPLFQQNTFRCVWLPVPSLAAPPRKKSSQKNPQNKQTSQEKHHLQPKATIPNCHPQHHLPPKKPCNLRSLLLSSPSLDPNCRDDRGDTALHLAAGNGERGACELLLKHPRIDRTLQDEDGRTEPWCFFFQRRKPILRGFGDVGAEGGRGFTNFWISHIVFFWGGW